MFEIRINKSIYGGWNWHIYIDGRLVANSPSPVDRPIIAATQAENWLIGHDECYVP